MITSLKNNCYIFLYREVKKITKLHSCLYKDYEEISEKYAEVIGHQNPKQRIKHVTQLKDKIYQMEQVRWFIVLFLAVILYYTSHVLMKLLFRYFQEQ